MNGVAESKVASIEWFGVEILSNKEMRRDIEAAVIEAEAEATASQDGIIFAFKVAKEDLREFAGLAADMLKGFAVESQDILKKRGKPMEVELPINNALYGVLARMDIHRGKFLFPSPRNEDAPISFSFATHYFKKLLTYAGLPAKYVFHSLRHSFTTHLRSKQVPIDAIQRLQSHSSPTVTWRYYDHSSALDFAEYSQRVDFGLGLEDRVEEDNVDTQQDH